MKKRNDAEVGMLCFMGGWKIWSLEEIN